MATTAPIQVRRIGLRSPIEYWHLLSLDAPTVAALWSYAFCRAAHVRCQPAAVLFMALGTWLLYVADRLLDGIFASDSGTLRERHHFHARHKRAFSIAALAICTALFWIVAEFLPRLMLREFAAVLTAALLYFALVHSGIRVVSCWFPKEVAVGLIFAAAVAVPALSQFKRDIVDDGNIPYSTILLAAWLPPEFVGAVVLLAALCWLNCVAIESWEYLPPRAFNARSARAAGLSAPVPGKLLGTWARGRVVWIAFTIAGAACIAALSDWSSLRQTHATRGSAVLDVSIMLSALLLLMLHSEGTRISTFRLRIAADAVLLTPLLFLPWTRIW